MDLALNNQQRLICHKTKITNHLFYCNIFVHLYIIIFFISVFCIFSHSYFFIISCLIAPYNYSKMISIFHPRRFPLHLLSFFPLILDGIFLGRFKIHFYTYFFFFFQILGYSEPVSWMFCSNFSLNIRILSIDVILYFLLIFLAFQVFTLTPFLTSPSIFIFYILPLFVSLIFIWIA